MFISPKIIRSAEDVQNVVSRFDISVINSGFGFGGRYMRRNSTGERDLHLNARHSNEDSSGNGCRDYSRSLR